MYISVRPIMLNIKWEGISGADPGFQVSGGVLKIMAPSGPRRENVGVFRVKNHDFTQKNNIFFQFGGGRTQRPPLGSAPGINHCRHGL